MSLSFIANELNNHGAKNAELQGSYDFHKEESVVGNSRFHELARLSKQADLVVRGQVIGIDSHWTENRSSIESLITVDVFYHTGETRTSGLVPHQLNPIVFRSIGGFIEAEGIGMMNPHLASFTVDDQILVFLKTGDHNDEEDSYRLVDHERGVFYISRSVAVQGDGVGQWHTRDLFQHINAELIEQDCSELLPKHWESVERNRHINLITQARRATTL